MDQISATKADTRRLPRDDGTPGARRRARTRRAICDAACTIFIRDGFALATMEEIAGATGIRRSTLYTHFAHKEGILAAIGEEYVLDTCDVIRQLPGPVPSPAEITAWVATFAAFVAERPSPAELVLSAGHQADVLDAATRFGDAMMRCFAERITAFDRALRRGEGFRLAWAHATLHALASAATHGINQVGSPTREDRLAVAAMLLGCFVRDRGMPDDATAPGAGVLLPRSVHSADAIR